MSHLKRLPAPKTWKISRKERKYVTKPHPGAHSLDMGMSLNTLMTSMGFANTRKEVKNVLNRKKLQVDWKTRHEEKMPVGFMDVLSFPDAKEHYRIMITGKGLEAQKIDEKDAKLKPVKVTGKTNIKGGKVQLHTMDGRNITVDKDTYKVGDTIVLDLPSQKISEHVKFEKGAQVLLYKGQHAGKLGKLEGFEGNMIEFSSGKDSYHTKRDYAFVIGKDKPVIKIQNE